MYDTVNTKIISNHARKFIIKILHIRIYISYRTKKNQNNGMKETINQTNNLI